MFYVMQMAISGPACCGSCHEYDHLVTCVDIDTNQNNWTMRRNNQVYLEIER